MPTSWTIALVGGVFLLAVSNMVATPSKAAGNAPDQAGPAAHHGVLAQSGGFGSGLPEPGFGSIGRGSIGPGSGSGGSNSGGAGATDPADVGKSGSPGGMNPRLGPGSGPSAPTDPVDDLAKQRDEEKRQFERLRLRRQ